MADYTPTTRYVREAYARSIRQAFITSTGEHLDEFDRWLDTVQHEAWQIGYLRGVRDEVTEVTHEADNPYTAHPLGPQGEPHDCD